MYFLLVILGAIGVMLAASAAIVALARSIGEHRTKGHETIARLHPR